VADKIVIAGSIAQRPGLGGHTWVFLQYLLGFRRLGWDVLFLDRLEPDMLFETGCPSRPEGSRNVRYLEEVMRRFDLGSAYSLLYDGGRQCLGLTRREVLKRVEASDLLININGFLMDEEILGRAPLRVFLDIDPGFGQMWHELGLHSPFHGHDAYVTIGENIGEPDCTIPTCALEWITTRHPVLLEQWPPHAASDRRFTTVGSWRGPYGPVEYRGRTYGLRVHEFRKFAEIPRKTARRFELALDIHPSESRDLELLAANDWSVVNPKQVAGDPWMYRTYVQGSGAEFAVAKNMYVQSRSGWFSDRSICYLASGKPVLAQDTGFSRFYAGDEGLLAFRTLDEAVAGTEEICGNYGRHARAARLLAEEIFDCRKVLGGLLAELGLG
jgi:hypothetical protein